MKKISLFLVVAFVMTILAACGKSATPASTPAASTSDTPAAAPAAAETAPSGEPVKITFMNMWVGQDSKAETCKQIIAEFNEENKGKIEVIEEEYPDVEAYRNKIRTMISANQVPDFFIVNESGRFKLQKYVDTGKILDFTPYLDADPEWKSTFDDSILDAMTFDGKIMFIPGDKAIVPIYYNLAQFADAGITAFPKNYDEYFAALDKLKGKGYTPVLAAFGGGANDQWFASQLFSNYVFSVANEDVVLKACMGEMSFEEKPFIEGAAFLQRLGMEGYLQPSYVSDLYDDVVAKYTSEGGAMIGNGAWMLGQIESGSPTCYENTAVSSSPGANAVLETINTHFVAVDSGDQAKNDALALFAKKMMSPDSCKRYYLATGTTWCTKFDIAPGEGDTLANAIIESSKNAAFAGTTVLWSSQPEVQQVFAGNIAALTTGKMTPEEFCKLVEEANKAAFAQ